MAEQIKHGGFRAFYSRPPMFMVVTAPTQEALTAKIADMDRSFAEREAKSND